MQADRTPRHIRIGATILLVLVAVETVYYTGSSFFRAYRFSFGEPDRWNTHWRVDPGTVIEFPARLGYFTFWGLVVLASVAAYVAGLHLLNRVRRGLIYDRGTAASIRRLGLVLAFAMVLDQVYQSMDLWLITRFNAEPHPVYWAYDPSDLKTLAMAVLLCLFGWVMRDSIAIEQENRGFV